uniref:Protein kinase domain-containing protein n=1 Tax=Cucumis melo TaxID=3656 RepID=A0A9I9EBA9_CUCME
RTLKDGRTVAVKRLYENNYQSVVLFTNEVEILSKLQHPNLVKLYRCTSRQSRGLLLVYDCTEVNEMKSSSPED